MKKRLGKIKNERLAKRVRRKLHVRKKVCGTGERPRMCVFKSNKHLAVQVIDDDLGKTLVSVQTFGKNGPADATKSKDGAKLIGTKVATLLQEKGIGKVVFDRNGYRYTGLIATLADAVREGSIKF